MAGVKIEKLKKLFNTNNSIFRVMPNIFSGIGMGVNGLFINKKVNKEKISRTSYQTIRENGMVKKRI